MTFLSTVSDFWRRYIEQLRKGSRPIPAELIDQPMFFD